MFSTPKSLRSTAPKGRSLTEYDSDDEGDDLREKRRNQKREHEEQSKEGGAGGGDSPLKSFKTQRTLSYEDSDDVLGTIAAMKDDGQESLPSLSPSLLLLSSTKSRMEKASPNKTPVLDLSPTP